jgi:hypothetical protein
MVAATPPPYMVTGVQTAFRAQTAIPLVRAAWTRLNAAVRRLR